MSASSPPSSVLPNARQFATGHDDIVHDVAYDYYGRRIATCSSDLTIKVWDAASPGQPWTCTASWKAHGGSVWQLSWAHPEFGQILASCSFDRTICVWEEQESPSGGGTVWVRRATLVDARDSVGAVTFAPRHLGLKLATASADGRVRVYEAVDVMNLTHWPLMEEFEVSRPGADASALAASGAAGGDAAGAGAGALFGGAGGGRQVAIDWNGSRADPPTLVEGGENGVRVWGYDESARRWTVLGKLEGCAGRVHDVTWAPNIGRTYHLIAAAGADRSVRVWKVRLPGEAGAFEATPVPELQGHQCEVWRVQWNITGTVLASSGDDGALRLWKANHMGNWQCISVVPADERG